MRKLRINFDEIQKAMEDVVRDAFDYYLDLATGEVIALSGEVLSEVESRLYESDEDEIDDDIEYIEFDEEPDLPQWMEDEVELSLEVFLNKEGRYIRIPERESLEAYGVMADFVETVHDSELKERLTHVLNGKGAFRRFKDILLDYSKERKRWHGYNAKAIKKVILQWFDSLAIEPEPIYTKREVGHVREIEL